MINIQNIVKEILEIQKTSRENLISNTTTLLLVGYCSNKMPEKINLDLILNSLDIKKAIKDSLIIIKKEFPEIKEAITFLEEITLSNEEISKTMVVLKSSLFEKEDFKEVLEYMLEEIGELLGKYRDTIETPEAINRLAVQIVEPIKGEFYDGTFGIGGSAINSYKFAKEYGNQLNIYGQEIEKKTYAIACIRMFLNEVDNFDIKFSDMLTNPMLNDDKKSLKKFDSIIVNPPFSMTWKDKENEILKDKYSRFIYGVPGVASSDWLFISSVLKSLKEDGKAIVITTLGSLFRGGAEESLRSKIISFDYIESVIELAGGLFNTTAIPCTMIVFNMNKSEEMKNKIQFINADTLCENVRRGKTILNDENINTILDIYREKKIVEDLSIIIDTKDIVNGILSPARYVVKTEFISSKYGKVKIHLDKLTTDKTLGDVGEFYRGINITSKNVQDSNGEYKIINLSDVKDGNLDIDSIPRYNIENNARVEAYKVEEGDIIISNKGATKICIIPKHEDNILISQNFIGIKLKSNYNPQYIKAFLESPIGEYLIDSKKTGTAVAMINPKDLKDIPLVNMSLENQNQMISKYIKEEEELRLKIKKVEQELENLKIQLYDKMNIKETFEKI